MKKIILLIAGMFLMQLLNAQVNMTIGSGAQMVVAGTAQVVMDTGNFVNDGTYYDSSGVFKAAGGVTFSGTGTTQLFKLRVNNSQHSTVNSLISVYDTANLIAGYLNANNQLYIRSDEGSAPHMKVTGVLTNPVRGIIARATVTTGAGCTPYTSDLTLNISGPAMVYQWQISPDSASWTNIAGATNGVYTATVSATNYYRCYLTTNNSSYLQTTPGVLLSFTGVVPPITGLTNVCTGLSITLSNAAGGGTWSSSNANATVDPTTGVVTGVTAGVVTISYTLSPGCYETITVYVHNIPLGITGTTTTCEGSSTTLASSSPGGAWTSSDPTIASVHAVSGAVTGVSGGTATITYTLVGCFATKDVSINPLPAAITGSPFVCLGTTTTLNSTTAGGTWTSANIRATVDPSSGIVTGNIAGTVNIYYTLSTGCRTTVVVTVSNLPSAIVGTLTLCAGSVTSLGSASPGGTWSTTDIAIATSGTAVSATTAITGVSVGTTTVSYTKLGCARTAIVTVTAAVPAIVGDSIICPGGNITLTNPTSGGTWSSSNISKATINVTTGVVSAYSAGTANITYKISPTCFSLSTITVNSIPAAITGTMSVCVGEMTTLSHPTSGGTWSSSNPAKATIDASTGEVTGISAGALVITYYLSSGCFKTASFVVNTLPLTISGTASVCEGASTTLTSSSSGGSWSSSDAGIFTVPSYAGTLTGVSEGTATITFQLTSTGCYRTQEVTVNVAPTAISGSSPICVGSTSAFTSTPTGGTWTSSAIGIATVDPTTGIVTGLTGGGSNISYTLSNGCYKKLTISVANIPGAITGSLTICEGNTTTLLSGSSGLTWSSSDIAVATVVTSSSIGGTVSGISAGTATISYTNAVGCSRTVEVTVAPALPANTGGNIVCAGQTLALSNAVPGGTWSSSAGSYAVVNISSGIVTGGVAGTTNISYKVGAGCYSITTVTVNAAMPAITGAGGVCIDAATTLSNTVGGGTWSSSSPSQATVDGVSGIVTGIASGSANITYRLNSGCFKTKVMNVYNLPSAITGTTTIATGSTTTLSCSTTGGRWSSSNTAIATIGSLTGNTTGISDGVADISYQIVSTGCYVTTVVTVTPGSSLRPVANWTPDGENVPIFRVYPNPSQGELNIETDLPGVFMVFSIDGKEIARYEIDKGTMQIKLANHLTTGIYMCRFVDKNGIVKVVRLIYEP
jgi:trimeric autotransporter adhesin